jgi:hypothetical protein
MAGYISVTIHAMPVFRPNDYFWQNHWDGKEEKWVAYARAMRQIMADAAEIKLSEVSLEAKMDFKNLVRGKPIKKRE